jgi:hypothetical protein
MEIPGLEKILLTPMGVIAALLGKFDMGDSGPV